MRPLLPLAALAVAVTATLAPGQADLDHFEKSVRPLLARRCFGCHGPKRQESGLRLDLAGGLRAGGSRGALFVPGQPAKSLLLRAVQRVDPNLQMPPKTRLPDDEIATLTKWVADGAALPIGEEVRPDPGRAFDLAERRKHWAWQAIRRPAVPTPTDPAWPRGGIDRFVLARLENSGLTPAPDATRRTLIRRVYFDLIGLPPSPDEVALFVSDRSPFAWRGVVSRLLASPHFGERWARHWLDLVRYSESRGHEFDYPQPNAWHYRDYLIRAFNRDVPYDQLVREHVAGDLLSEPRLHPATGGNESVLGTGFWFLGEEVHSPVDPRVEECDRIDNKVDVFSKAFLGLTVGCARCHDHKFDAITTADYYALSGFLLSSGYRQVRFDTMVHNERIAASLASLTADARPRLGRAVAAATRPQVDTLARYLEAARTTLLASAELSGSGPVTLPSDDYGVVFEDFEGASYGTWEREGTAFGSSPMRASQMPEYQGRVEQLGSGLVNTHDARAKPKGGAPDQHVGRLVSRPFEIRHPFIQFLIGGGAHRGRMYLGLVVGGRTVRTATGRKDNRMRRAHFDVRDLQGRRAHFEIVDRERGGWGNVGVDHIAFTPDASYVAFHAALDPAEGARIQQAAEQLAREHHLDPERLFRTALRLRADAVVDVREASQPAPTNSIVVVDYDRLAAGQWLQNGFTFGTAPRPAGILEIDGSAARPRLSVRHRAAAVQDRVWDGLVLSKDTERDPSKIKWVQAGRTLRTPTFELQRKKLFYLVRGAGHALAVVDSHRLIDGPLHHRNIRSFDAGSSGYRWIEHDVSACTGRRVLVEISPRGRGAAPLAIARIVQADDLPKPAGLATNGGPRHDRAPTPGALGAAIEALASGAVGAAHRRAASWLLSHTELLARPLANEPAVRGVLGIYFTTRERLRARIATRSRTAPAMLDATGVDSPILARGDARAPGDRVRRRFLEAIDPSACGSEGSGRLALTERMLAADNPLTARVLVNRVWHHLFGRGIVATVDNFGLMGEQPTHPELLDWLTRRFIDNGWSIKQLIREIVLSRTYGMSSVARPAAKEVDPDNRLLHAMRVKRLQGEVIRDAMLAVSGRLDRKLHGKSIPLHPEQYFRSAERNLPRGPLDGDGRRSIYLAVRRNCLMKFFLAFDYPLPATARGRRTVTNVPAQALALMNNPLCAQLARHWAQGLPKAAADDERVSSMFERAFGRSPADSELQSALAFLAAQRRAEPAAEAVDLWADLAHVLFNVKEFIFVK